MVFCMGMVSTGPFNRHFTCSILKGSISVDLRWIFFSVKLDQDGVQGMIFSVERSNSINRSSIALRGTQD